MTTARARLKAPTINAVRLTTGLVLFTYVASHLSNHALGLVSLDVMEEGRRWFSALWRFPPATVAFYGAILVHMGIALRATYRRRTLRMPAWEAAQLVLGLSVPLLLVEHALANRATWSFHGVNPTYSYVTLYLWAIAPVSGLVVVLGLLAAWAHGCIGLHFWLRLKRGYGRAAPVLLALAVLVPVLALLGFVTAGREALALAQNEDWLRDMWATANLPNSEAAAMVGQWKQILRWGFAALIAAVLAARVVRDRILAGKDTVKLTMAGGRVIEAAPGMTMLDAIRAAGVPHASVCGGRGRCSTCRVRVNRGLARLPPPDEGEARVLERVGAAPNVRLACQTPASADAEIVPLLAPTATPRDARGRPRYLQGEEREIAVLFADLRGFTSFAEKKLPYDVVFILNRYFAAMGSAVEDAGGYVDKFIGDGVMALFGVDSTGRDGCRAALTAARTMAERLAILNDELAGDLESPLRMGIGIHAGPVVVGELGHGRTFAVTAIGDAVNTASRLEALTKDADAQLMVSEVVRSHAEVEFPDYPRQEIELRGREGRLTVHIVADASTIPRMTSTAKRRAVATG
jgi:adenylate cyclase